MTHSPERLELATRTVVQGIEEHSETPQLTTEVRNMIKAVLAGNLTDPQNPITWTTRKGREIICTHPRQTSEGLQTLIQLEQCWLSEPQVEEPLPTSYINNILQKAPELIVTAHHRTPTENIPACYVIASRVRDDQSHLYYGDDFIKLAEAYEENAANEHTGNKIIGVGVITKQNYQGDGIAKLTFLASHKALATLNENLTVETWSNTPIYQGPLENYDDYIRNGNGQKTEKALRTQITIGSKILRTAPFWPNEDGSLRGATRISRTHIVEAFKKV